MTFRRTGLALAVVAVTALPACSMWNSMSDRMTGRSPDPASDGRGTMGGSTMEGASTGGSTGSGMAASGGTAGSGAPGGSMTALRGDPTTAGAMLPQFRSYNECRSSAANQPTGSRAMNRGQLQGGEVTLADQDLCARFPRS